MRPSVNSARQTAPNIDKFIVPSLACILLLLHYLREHSARHKMSSLVMHGVVESCTTSYTVFSVGCLANQPFQDSIEIRFFFGTDSIAANFAMRYCLHI